MKILTLLTLLCITNVMATGLYSQNARLTMKLSNTTVADVLQEIESQTEFNFFYNNKLIDVSREVNISVDNQDIYNVLDQLFGNTDVTYVVQDKHIVLSNQISETRQTQSFTVKGKVSDESNSPIIGVSVVIKGTTNGTVTNVDGEYVLNNIDPTSTLIFSFIGMSNAEVAVNGKNIIDVVMQPETYGLEEVVAIGYGVQKKKLVTGSTIQVDGDDLAKRNSVDVLGALQSMAPGVNIVQSSGQPGEGYKINIRGLGTTGSSTPLVVIDGVAGGSLEALDPSDIESIDILKDAASSAIYGARAANGVILVSTKKGKIGDFDINYDGYTGVQNANLNGIETLNAQQYMEIVNGTLEASGSKAYKFNELIPNYYESITNGSWEGTNWIEESLNPNAPIQSHAININGGSEMSRVAVGFSYLGQEGTIGKSAIPNYERFTARINSDHSLLRKNGRDIVTFGENVTYTVTNKSGVSI
nr:TonB-dependent receptor plug domain-containing protein [Prolixibacteraceae bacterium]